MDRLKKLQEMYKEKDKAAADNRKYVTRDIFDRKNKICFSRKCDEISVYDKHKY